MSAASAYVKANQNSNETTRIQRHCTASAKTAALVILVCQTMAHTYHTVHSSRGNTRRLMCRDKSSITHKMIRILLVVSVKDIAHTY